jgi:serine protease AprX
MSSHHSPNLLPLCPLCARGEAALRYDAGAALAALIQANAPGWQASDGLCPRCFDLFSQAGRRLQNYPQIFRDGAYRILPTPLRMGADERFAGRGVTIAFLDSGFYPHPDLTQPHNRVACYVNITEPGRPARATEEEFRTPNVSSWHGMMTSVVAAGAGYLSQGLYRGIASEARVMLVKVGAANRIAHDDIRRGLEWVLAHKDKYGVRIVNISCGGDYEASYLNDELSQAAENAVRAGLVVVCAAGNAGHSPRHAILPPASAPAVITVGGFNDRNTLELADNEVYQSSYGPTLDGLQKPEIIAPSIFLAAPILPGTPTAEEAALYERLHAAADHDLHALLQANAGVDRDLDAARELPAYLIRQLLAVKIHDANVISGHYKHVDGSSFAAPIVSSVIAQMLEANPRLTPQQVKRILIDTAIRLTAVPVERQGWGTIIPARAVARALQTGKDSA